MTGSPLFHKMRLALNIIHIIEDFSPSGGGVATALAELSGRLSSLGVKQTIITPLITETPPPMGVRLYQLPIKKCCKAWLYPIGLKKTISESLDSNTVVHIHGMWLAPQYLAAREAIRHGVPYCISTHNSLGEWTLKKDGIFRRIKKDIYRKLFLKGSFSNVSAVHALTDFEREALCRFFPGKPIMVIPNGIDLNRVDQSLLAATKSDKGIVFGKYILILGRLHRVKGIEIFINAYAKIESKKRIPVIIVGPPHQESYLLKLKSLVKANGLESTISFKGPVFGSEKWNLLYRAWAVVAPSFSEGMSMVALEAMAASVPILTTYTAGIHRIPEGGGILINPNVNELYGALLQVLDWEEEERILRGSYARKLIEKYYSWDMVAFQYLDFYRKLC